MPQDYQPTEEYYNDAAGRLKDVEEKQRLLRDKILLIGRNVVEDRESIMQEIEEMKKLLAKTREENIKIQDFLKKVDKFQVIKDNYNDVDDALVTAFFVD